MTSMMSALKQALNKIGLGTVYQRFVDQKIDENLVRSLSDEDLMSLGVETIGDRIRLRRILDGREPAEHYRADVDGPTASSSRQISSGVGIEGNNIARREQERSHIFGGRRSRTIRKQGKSRKTWTVSFVCLANKKQKRVPTSAEKNVLFHAGLGMKRVQLSIEDSEDYLIETLTSEVGFPQLKGAGGFELMRCKQNCRDLEVIQCNWSVSELKSFLGGQVKVYLRPIQKNLSTQCVVHSNEKQRKEKCKGCGKEVNLKSLRSHTSMCTSGLNQEELSNDSDSSQELINIHQGSDIQPYVAQEEIHTEVVQPRQLEESAGSLENINSELNRFDSPVAQERNPSSEVAVHVAATEISLPDLNNNNISVEDHINLQTDISMDSLIETCISDIFANDISDPVQMLRYLQTKIVTGRELEISNESDHLEGETNFILVDRNDLLKTAFDEIKNIPATSIRLTLEVQFYGEVAQDYGGPRKEFFRLILREIKEKYFDPELRVLGIDLSDYEIIGEIFALSVLQNGNIPQFMDPSVLTELFHSDNPGPVVKRLRKGLDMLGLYQVGSQFPMFIDLFRPTSIKMTFRRLTTIFRPLFHEEGSNARKFENMVYSEFLKYARESASGRRENMSLQKILLFATGTDQEPVLGFVLTPSIAFVESTGNFLPTANTCINKLNLPRPSAQIPLPATAVLFQLYDYAFSNAYYGLS